MSRKRVYLHTTEDTEQFGRALGKCADPGDLIYLDGDLGTGKTTLSQAIARGLDVPASCYVTSPSFAIFHEYPGRIPMYHMDFYRLNDSDDVLDLGFDEYFYLSGLTVIEWAERAKSILPEDGLHLLLEITPENSRTIRCEFSDQRWEDKLDRITKETGLSCTSDE